MPRLRSSRSAALTTRDGWRGADASLAAPPRRWRTPSASDVARAASRAAASRSDSSWRISCTRRAMLCVSCRASGGTVATAARPKRRRRSGSGSSRSGAGAKR